jgi:predicted DNA-binding transcriptional regulator AlpA
MRHGMRHDAARLAQVSDFAIARGGAGAGALTLPECVNLTHVPPRRTPLDLAGIAEVAQILGTSRTQAGRWARREDFPEPIARLRATPVWRADDVKAWAKQKKPVPVNRSSGVAGMLARSGDRQTARRRRKRKPDGRRKR